MTSSPDADPADVTAAVRAAGSDLLEGDELGGVSIVGIGIGTHPEICSHGLGVLERMDVEPQLVKTASGQVTRAVSQKRPVRAEVSAVVFAASSETRRRADRRGRISRPPAPRTAPSAR
jgi:hypothetical protein